MAGKALKSKTISKKSTKWMEKVFFSPPCQKQQDAKILWSNLKANILLNIEENEQTEKIKSVSSEFHRLKNNITNFSSISFI